LASLREVSARAARLLAMLLLAVFVGHHVVTADEPEDAAEIRAATLERLLQVAKSYTITLDDDSGKQLELVTAPVLRYSDPVSAITDGIVLVWTKDGRPEAAMGIHPGSLGRTWFEFQSLSGSPLRATAVGQPQWRSEVPGVEFRSMEDVPLPARSAAERLTQMRSMLRSFTASIADNRSGRQELRLLPVPVFRYSQTDRGILDGAVFAFVRATNPELLIVVEAQVVDGNDRWLYSPARFTGRECELRLKHQSIWSHGQLKRPKDPTASYFQSY
jgi:hypothetical protein